MVSGRAAGTENGPGWCMVSVERLSLGLHDHFDIGACGILEKCASSVLLLY